MKEHGPSTLCDFSKLRIEVRPGDVILVEGCTGIARWIKLFTTSHWAHSMLYIGRLYDIEDPDTRDKVQSMGPFVPCEQLVIESVWGEGVIVTRLRDYEGSHMRICRPRGIVPMGIRKVIEYAAKYLGQGYDLKHIFDLMRYILPLPAIIRKWKSCLWEHRPNTPSSEICSSLIAAAFHSVCFPILPTMKKSVNLYTPSDFDYSPYFDIIKYPMEIKND